MPRSFSELLLCVWEGKVPPTSKNPFFLPFLAALVSCCSHYRNDKLGTLGLFRSGTIVSRGKFRGPVTQSPDDSRAAGHQGQQLCDLGKSLAPKIPPSVH